MFLPMGDKTLSRINSGSVDEEISPCRGQISWPRTVVPSLRYPDVFGLQKSWPVQLKVKVSGNFSPTTSGEARLGSTGLDSA